MREATTSVLPCPAPATTRSRASTAASTTASCSRLRSTSSADTLSSLGPEFVEVSERKLRSKRFNVVSNIDDQHLLRATVPGTTQTAANHLLVSIWAEGRTCHIYGADLGGVEPLG